MGCPLLVVPFVRKPGTLQYGWALLHRPIFCGTYQGLTHTCIPLIWQEWPYYSILIYIYIIDILYRYIIVICLPETGGVQRRWKHSNLAGQKIPYIPISSFYTSSTAQGGGGSFKNRKPIGEVGCCESGMAERSHWLTERWLELCLLEWLQWLQWSPHPQLLDVVWCTATVVVVVA